MKFQFAASLALVAGLLGGCDGAAADDVAATHEPLLLYNSATWDNSTPCSFNGINMHCCPTGQMMIGARLDQNAYKCVRPYKGTVLGAPFIDGPDGVGNTIPTQRQGMHACPLGSVMVGLHKDRNDLMCANNSAINAYTNEQKDTGTQDAVGHVCAPAFPTSPFGQVTYNGRAMTGIHEINNWLLCAL